MKVLERIAIFIVALTLLAWTFRIGVLYRVEVDASDVQDLATRMNAERAKWFVNTAATVAIPLVIQIALAVWMFLIARRDGESKWVWCLVGLVLGVQGLLLYFVSRLYFSSKTGDA